ncbi:hypothetical protein BJ878DRAFT_482304 [Calycina marina]|uniref:Uncharacterized protein n=1 Tax=Calycina marina TaxID=1763456 RepID=A0A9P7YY68_9HELO|nr:hypothetical protein BJ878DRAFT_482304 [Calycina marina]
MIGVPGGPAAAGSGYVTPAQLAPTIQSSKVYSSFAGIMIWDTSQVYQNLGFLDGVSSDLGLTPPSTTMVSVTTSKATSTAVPTSGSGTIAQYVEVMAGLAQEPAQPRTPVWETFGGCNASSRQIFHIKMH